MQDADNKEASGAPQVSARGKPLSAVRRPEILFALEYWNDRRGARTMPARRDLEPLDFPHLWPKVLLLDVTPDGMRMRLVGTEVVTMFGRDYTGQFLEEIDFGSQRDAIVEQYRHVAESGQPFVVDQPFRDIEGHLFDMERLILPLSDDDTRVNMLFAVLCVSTLHGIDS